MLKGTALAATLAVLTACSASGNASRGPAAAGKPAPDFTLPLSTGAGNQLAFASLRGKPVYLNFFATWCPPCNEEAPDVNALQKKYASKDLRVIGVDELEDAQKAESFRKKFSLVFPAVVDSGTLQAAYAVNGLPVHVFVDRNGVIKSMFAGELTKAQIEARIRQIL